MQCKLETCKHATYNIFYKFIIYMPNQDKTSNCNNPLGKSLQNNCKIKTDNKNPVKTLEENLQNNFKRNLMSDLIPDPIEYPSNVSSPNSTKPNKVHYSTTQIPDAITYPSTISEIISTTTTVTNLIFSDSIPDSIPDPIEYPSNVSSTNSTPNKVLDAITQIPDAITYPSTIPEIISL